MKKKIPTLILSFLSIPMFLCAQNKTIQLFPDGAPGETTQLTEKNLGKEGNTGGKPVLRLTDIGNPSITIYPAPKEKSTGAAMIVCPGGAYNILAYDLEGTEVCDWLNDLGITAVLLKYRVPRREGRPKHEAPLQDAQRAIRWTRAHAAELNIQSDKIGIMGFSAGGHLSAMASTAFRENTYPTVDEADRESARPDFCLLVYPAYLDGKNFQVAPEVNISKEIPPTLMIQAEDDKDYIDSSIFYYYALKQAGVPAWMHLYSRGGHGYGLRNTGCAVNEWPKRAEAWFRELGVIGR